MKRRTFISLMSVMAAAGVLTLSGCSNSSGSTAASGTAASVAPAAGDQLSNIQSSGKLIVALEGAWQPWSYHDESDTLVGYDVEVSRAIAEKLGVEPEYVESDWDSLFAGLDAGRYDIVCNGNEMGGGSVRIHRDDIQDRVLDVLGITPEEAADKFGFLLEAFKYGAPPHAGIALGWDRTAAILAGADSIRDVMAFPKTASGSDLMSGAPSAVSGAQLKDVSLRLM